MVRGSQWQHGSDAMQAIDWAFDKLRLVKGDIKVLIYEVANQPEGTQLPRPVGKVVTEYLMELSLLSTDEAFLFLNFNRQEKWTHWWQPNYSGKPSQILFAPIRLD
jgi:hypothetical protein